MACRVCGLTLPDAGEVGRFMRQTARLMVGVGDYDTYVAHAAANHPDKVVMTRTEFFRRSQDRRYGGGPEGTFRCC
ncbi:YbdD/YjiX family protein [Siculibacillus lacustris]|uniref:YbdD/YjiX family protein n=1 Tax=Siculibacillus lacustris TaxID=1549641 RepID=A0A4Q9VRN2_9HYPH|nr:CstA-like transporter-associated (seleno)protein [Siculibacillus lacustris]TBW37572.1 YbdD/YjiX family protein [Siculibacillus lacustris]